ncbi:MAG: maleylpyruvate isomerase family mycothiol-dependent enzyme [Sciscionella sp.]|nr:maleylpyruvate isomerase family mycothiol-dependent enzyme [Sciscionella sp.]
MTSTQTDVRQAIAAERTELAEFLAGLTADDWDRPTLCEGWRVREVVAHMTMPFRLSTARFAAEMIKSRGNFNRMADRLARADAVALSPAEMTASLRDNVNHPWKPPGGGFTGALSHDVIHGLDITVALGVDRTVPVDRMRIVLDGVSARHLKFFGVDLDGISLHANDIDWTFSAGTPLTGTSMTAAAQDLLLVLCGRKLPAGRLHGEPSARFSRS